MQRCPWTSLPKLRKRLKLESNFRWPSGVLLSPVWVVKAALTSFQPNFHITGGTGARNLGSIAVPAIEGHVLYWQVLYQNSSNAILAIGAMNATAIN